MLLLTAGEPAGIGPEVLLRAARARPELPLLAVADSQLLSDTAERLDIDITIHPVSAPEQAGDAPPGSLPVLHHELSRRAVPGRLDSANAPYVLNTLESAARLCQSGQARALVTAPVHKGVINEAGCEFSGHTEFLAALAGVDQVVMMLATDQLRVALVTTHLPLSQVSARITRPTVQGAIEILDRDLRNRFGIRQPRLQVLGLNPHAGEGGHLGHEDDAEIRPAIEAAQAAGIDARGPVPADTAFTPPRLAACDAVLAMYHDQGLPVLKHAGFGQAMNITLGLPYLRLSVDHGTALDIAGQGVADPASLLYVLDHAAAMTRAGSGS